jgi:hypothetical protein
MADRKISELAFAAPVTGAELVHLVQNGVNVKARLNDVALGSQKGDPGLPGPAGAQGVQGPAGPAGPATMPSFDANYTYNVPVAGFDLTVNTPLTILDPAGTLPNGTLIFPAAPVDGQILRVSSSRVIAVLTLDGNGKTVKAPVTTLGAGAFFEYRFRSANNTWFRSG